MHCRKCKTYARKNELLARYPDGCIPEDLRMQLIDACIVCSHGCVNAKGKPRCRHYRVKVALGKEVAKAEKSVAAIRSEIARLESKGREDLYGYSIAVQKGKLKAEEASLREKTAAYEDVLRECSECTQSSDDFPSNSGQTFISIDEGVSGDSLADVNDALQDHILSQRIDTTTPSPRATSLPPDVEDRLRKELASFTQLDMADKFLVCVLMTAKKGHNDRFHSITDFAKDFAPYVFGRPISKQAAHARFVRVVKRVPILAAIAHGQIGKGKGGGAKRSQSGSEERQIEFNFMRD